MTLEKIEAQVKELGEGFHAFQKLQEKAVESQSAELKAQIERVATSVATNIEAIQTQQQKLEATMQRVATSDKNAVDPEAKAKREAFVEFMRKGNINLMNPERVKGLATDSLDNGGYMVPTESMGIINGRIFETSPLRRVANVVTTSAKSIELVMDDDQAAFNWVGEGDPVNATGTPKLGRLEIAAHKGVAYPVITEELVADAAFDVESWLAGKVADVISRGENTAFVSGNGVNAPRGYLTYNTAAASGGVYTYARNQLEYVPMGSTSAVTEAGMINLQGSLKEAYQQNAVFGMKRSTLVNLMTVAGTNNYRWLNLSAIMAPNKEVVGPSINVLDKQVILMDDMPGIGSNALGIVYGDFKRGYTIVDRVGLAVRADPYTSPGFIKYYTTKRTGGAVTNFEALKLSKFSVS